MLFTIAIKVSKHFAMFLNKLMENLALKIFLRTSSVVLRCFCIFYYRFNPITLLDTNRRNGKFIYKIVKTAHFSTPFYLELSQNCCAAPTLRCLFFQTGIFPHSLLSRWLLHKHPTFFRTLLCLLCNQIFDIAPLFRSLVYFFRLIGLGNRNIPNKSYS